MCSHFDGQVCRINGRACSCGQPPKAICRRGVEFDKLKKENEELQQWFKELFG